ncbi:conserved hypothetical protein [Histoplasma mississippiense (nom. inval.)]|uniref:conserved hypothetical protein n=1 Tax=Ajellomyces capsulatus (strain NAm1 / WU24) TaxID=2059318 RepID=UPI000157C8A3|nr:conserved hypothetical protein [Histoplasma mississippiense (nom. inval.)]EDN08959.1 conserved hypothetical protein [Histoplasma mississippiense (nom. inval.)]
MHPFSVLALGIFVAGYITARWDLVTRLYELAIFAWDHGVVTRTAKGFAVLSIFYFLFIIPINLIVAREINSVNPLGAFPPLTRARSTHKFRSIRVRPSHLYITWNPSSKVPRIFCPPETKLSIQIITFNRPHPMRMHIGRFEQAEVKAKAQTRKLVEKLKLHTVVRHIPSPKEQILPAIINQVNCSFEVEKLLAKNVGLVGARPKRSLSVSERVVESASTAWDFLYMALSYIFLVWIYPVITQGFIAVLISHRVVAEVVLGVLEWRARPDAAALKDISATAQQIDIRLQQFCYWPIQYLTLRKRKDDWESVTNSHPDYIRFYNSLWLVANDVIIGIALGSYIMDNADWVASQINSILTWWTVEGLQRTISWLMGWPAGLKLNNELAVFMGDLFLWVIEHWASALASLRPFLRHVIYMIGCSGFAGGIHFSLREALLPNSASKTDEMPSTSTSYIHLQSIPLSLRQMFDQYFQLGHRLRKHYLSPSVILCLVTGRFVPPIHRRNMYSLQYSMLPAQRVGIGEVWSRLTEKKTRTANVMAPMPKIPNGFPFDRRRHRS